MSRMQSANQTPEQAARDKIDTMLEQAGWKVQSKKKIDFSAGLGIAVREYQTDIGLVVGVAAAGWGEGGAPLVREAKEQRPSPAPSQHNGYADSVPVGVA